MNAIKEIEKFATDRAIDKSDHSPLNYATNVVEELLELTGHDVSKENRSRLKDEFEAFIDSMVNKGIATKNQKPNTKYDTVDAIADVTVFSITELMKLNMSPEVTLLEVAKEINSRTGSILSGKFEKDMSDEAKANWYKADYTKGEL